MGNAYRSVLAGGGAGTPITPSNSSPVSMTGGETYTPTTNGVAVESVTNLTPANTSPPVLSVGNIYKPGSSGYAISSYSSSGKTPSSGGTYFSSGWNYMNSSGYAYPSQATSGKRGNFTATQQANTIECGFKPKSITVLQHDSSFSKFCVFSYDESASTTKVYGGRYNSSANSSINLDVPASGTGISEISSNGFKFNANALSTYGSLISWFAVG